MIVHDNQKSLSNNKAKSYFYQWESSCLNLILRFQQNTRRDLQTPSSFYQRLLALFSSRYTQSVVEQEKRKKLKFMRMFEEEQKEENFFKLTF